MQQIGAVAKMPVQAPWVTPATCATCFSAVASIPCSLNSFSPVCNNNCRVCSASSRVRLAMVPCRLRCFRIYI